MRAIISFSTLFVVLLVLGPLSVWSQTTLSGTIRDDASNETMIGATVVLKGTTTGTITDIDGNFSFEAPGSPPYTLEVSFVGYEKKEIQVTDASKSITVRLGLSSIGLKAFEVKELRVTEKSKESPQTVESLDAQAIKETPAANFYDGLGALKGVDLTASSIGFKIVNTRGFNSTSPVRSLQLIDGVDNQSPGLNFSIGNFAGAN